VLTNRTGTNSSGMFDHGISRTAVEPMVPPNERSANPGPIVPELHRGDQVYACHHIPCEHAPRMTARVRAMGHVTDAVRPTRISPIPRLRKRPSTCFCRVSSGKPAQDPHDIETHQQVDPAAPAKPPAPLRDTPLNAGATTGNPPSRRRRHRRAEHRSGVPVRSP